MKSTKTTKAHFTMFVDQALKEQVRWGLLGWQFNFYHGGESTPDVRAEVAYSTQARIADLYLSLDWGREEVTENQVRLSAFHEVMELLLADHLSLVIDDNLLAAQKRERLEQVSHNVIRTLENVVGYEGSK